MIHYSDQIDNAINLVKQPQVLQPNESISFVESKAQPHILIDFLCEKCKFSTRYKNGVMTSKKVFHNNDNDGDKKYQDDNVIPKIVRELNEEIEKATCSVVYSALR